MENALKILEQYYGYKSFRKNQEEVIKSILNKNDTVDMLLIAVKPELQGQGINALLMLEIQKTCIKYGIKYAETGPELEVNTLVRGQWEKYEHVLARKRRLFIAKLNELKVD